MTLYPPDHPGSFLCRRNGGNGNDAERKRRITNRKRNIITRAAGIRPDIVPDFFEEELEQGDYILLCSDGLSNMVDNDTLCSIILSEGSLKEKAQRLIAEANERGGTDNIAVVLVKPEEGGMGSC